MKSIKLFITGLLLLTAFNLQAQDVIVKTNKEEIKAKVLDVEETTIKYKKFDFQDGPTYSVKKSEVFMIIYKNGKRETFESTVAPKAQQKTGLEKALTTNPVGEDLAFRKGTKTLQFGLGLGGGFVATGAKITIPAIQARYEFSVTDKISGGFVLGYSAAKYNFGSAFGDDYFDEDDGYKYSYLLAGVRANYHFLTTKKFDPYVGVTLGYNSVSVSDGDGESIDGTQASAVLFGGQIGANYYFSDRFGAWADVGYGLGYLNLGVVFKF